MKIKFGKLLIIVGIFMFLMPIGNLVMMEYEREDVLKRWQLIELIKPPFLTERELLSMVYEEVPSQDTVFATLRYLNEESLPLYQGIDEKQLRRGLGHDPLSVLPGENGNSIVYGHREQFLWGLRQIEVGDQIEIETVYGTLIYEVQDIQVVKPTDPYIFEPTKEPTLTLVTCHPFVYFGPINERFIVKSKLIEKF